MSEIADILRVGCEKFGVCPLFDVIVLTVLTSHANANPSRLILLQNWSQAPPSSPRRGFQKSPQRAEKIPFVILPCASESHAEFVRGRDAIPAATYRGQFIGLASALVNCNQ
jgi:hypothetical protein